MGTMVTRSLRRPLLIGAVAGALLPAAAGAATPGTLDTTFSGDGVTTTDVGGRETALAVTVQPDGKLLVAGSSLDPATGRPRLVLARHLPSGAPDATFSGDGIIAIPHGADDYDQYVKAALRVRPDGKVMVVATDGYGIRIARLKPTGALDTTFLGTGLASASGPGNGIDDLALQPDGKVLVTGGVQQTAGWVTAVLYRLLPGGTRDTTFAPVESDNWNSYASFEALALQPDGKVVFHDTNSGLRRVLADGTPDSSFGTGGVAPGVGHRAIASVTQSDGRILAAGTRSNGRDDDLLLDRRLPDGRSDPSFGTGGVKVVDLGADERVGGLLVQPNGRIVVAATTGSTPVLVRLTTAGALDGSFGAGGTRRIPVTGAANDVALQADGKLVLAGEDDRDAVVARVWGDPIPACAGRVPTIAGGEGVVYGSDGADVIVGSTGPDVIYAGEGDDTVCSAAGADRVFGEPGADRLQGGLGNDRLEGGLGADLLFGEGDDDVLFGLADNDRLDGGTGVDHADGGAGTDTGTANETQVNVP